MPQFIGVYVALYDYDAQTDEELSIKQDDLLYLLEKSKTDDWWTVKKSVADPDVEEPVGLVPSTYIEPAKVQNKAKSLYDYEAQTAEELTFKEGATFDVYDTSDPNWTLVRMDDKYGFVPANYIEVGDAAPAIPASKPTSSTQPVNAYGMGSTADFAPPPQHKDLNTDRTGGSGSPVSARSPEQKPEPKQEEEEEDEEEEEPEAPPMPARPKPVKSARSSVDSSNHQQPIRSHPRSSNSPKKHTRSRESNPDEFYEDDFFTWPVYEIEGKKKRKARLEIGDSQVFITPAGSSKSRNWTMRDLMNYNSEKKHVFLDFKNPAASYELHAGSKDAADAIVSVLADLKGMTSMSAMKDIEEASKPSQRPRGKILYDFEAASPDEMTCYQGDLVYIINDKRSKEWWMVEGVGTGKKGVVPSNYIKVVGNGNNHGGWRRLFGRGSKGKNENDELDDDTNAPIHKSPVRTPLRSPTKKSRPSGEELEVLRQKEDLAQRQAELARREKRQKQRERELRTLEEREKVREADERARASRDSREQQHKSKHNQLAHPNPHRVRTWIDRTGAFKVEAEFLGVQDGKIHLHKINGVKIAVSAQKLSVEDLEYVERLTGVSLEKYKVSGKKHRHRHESTGQNTGSSVNSSSKNLASTKRSSTNGVSSVTQPPVNEKAYEYWFNFFLGCGADANMCEQYARTFAREQMDETVLEDITPTLLRSLGLREGDVLKVMKALNKKYGRGSQSEKEETKSEVKPTGSSKPGFEDEAWAIKPASKSADVLNPPESVQPQLTGSIQDLLDLKPMEPTKTSSAAKGVAPVPVKPVTQQPSQPAQPAQPQPVQPVQPVQNSQPAQQAPIIPPQVTGYAPLSAMPTGFMPISMGSALTGQPTGFIPVTTFGQQPTGIQPTVPGSLVQLQPTGVTIQKTGGVQLAAPATSFPAMQPTHTGIQTTFTGVPVQTSFTGVQPMQTTFTGVQPMQTTFTGVQPVQNTFTGVQPMQTTFTGGQPMVNAYTGQPMATTFTGGQPMIQPTMQQQPIIQQQPTMPQQQAMPQTSFGVPQLTGMMGGMSISQQNNQLTAQPTGAGFGNAPDVRSQPTGRQANLANATPDNPFGF